MYNLTYLYTEINNLSCNVVVVVPIVSIGYSPFKVVYTLKDTGRHNTLNDSVVHILAGFHLDGIPKTVHPKNDKCHLSKYILFYFYLFYGLDPFLLLIVNCLQYMSWA